MRRVDDYGEGSLGIEKISKSQTSELAKEFEFVAEEFRTPTARRQALHGRGVRRAQSS